MKSLHYSPNATFTIIEEIARIPVREKEEVTQNRLMEILSEIDRQFEHPLNLEILDMIEQKEIPIDEALSLMNLIQREKGLWRGISYCI